MGSYLGKSILDRSSSRFKGPKLGVCLAILGTSRRSVWLEYNEQWAKCQLSLSFLPVGVPSLAGKGSNWLSLP